MQQLREKWELLELGTITNDNKASDGTTGSGVGNTARTDGTQRAFTESQLKDVN